MNNLMIFEGKEVEVFEYEGQVLFNPRHVGKCLDIKDVTVRRAIQSMNDKQVVKITNSNVHSMNFRKLANRGENFVTESGVYKLIFKSKKKEAEKFQDWVADEVLPTIRKHGAYMTENTVDTIYNDPKAMIDLLTKLKDEKVVNNVYTLGGNQQTWFLTENGLYEVLMQSRKPIANK